MRAPCIAPAGDAGGVAAPVIAREQLTSALIAELMPLLSAHYREIALDQDVPLDPDWLRYAELQAKGALRVWTARVDGALIGYLAYLVSPHLHYRTLIVASQDVLYVTPDARGSRVGRFLLWHAEQSLTAEGVHMLVQHSKASPGLSIAPWLKRQGYRDHDLILSKRV